MASSYTENYGLCQWEAGDAFTRTEFNADNAKLDAALGRTERGMEANRTNLYNLLLQRDYEGKYTGWKQALIFDGFQDDSKIESLTDNMVRSQAGHFLFLNGKTSESEDVRFGTGASVTLSAGESATETWVCDRMGWATALRLYMQGHGTLVITNGLGTFTKTVTKGCVGSGTEEVAFPWGLTLDPGETYTFTFTASEQTTLYRTGTGSFGFRVMLTYVPTAGATGVLVTKPLSLDLDGAGIVAWTRFTTCYGFKLSVLQGEEWVEIPEDKTIDGYSLDGMVCRQRRMVLDPAPPQLGALTFRMELSAVPMIPVKIFDYGVAIL